MLVNPSRNRAISTETIKAIQEHPEELSMVVKLTTIGIKDVQKPLVPKIAPSEEEIRYCGDGSTAWGDIKAFFWNLLKCLIPYSQSNEGHVIGGKTTLDKKREESCERSRHLADAGIDDRNGSKRLNKLYQLPVAVVKDFTAIARELADTHGYLNFKSDEDEQVLYTLQLEKNENDPLQPNKGEQPSPYQIVANSEGLFCKAGAVEISKLMSLQEYNNNVALRKIRSQLTLEARLAFQPYFDLKKIGTVDDKSPIMVNGTYSVLHTIFMGIQAGHFELLNETAITLMADLINLNIKIAKYPHENGTIKQKINWDTSYKTLVDHLDFKEGGSPLIFSDSIALYGIEQQMIKKGMAHFIAGPQALENMPLAAMEKISKNVLKASDLYSNAYYDEGTKKLYLSNGCKINSPSVAATVQVETALGEYFVKSSELKVNNFVRWINDLALPTPQEQARFKKFKNFQPSSAEIQNAGEELGITIVGTGGWTTYPNHKNVLTLNPNKRGGLDSDFVAAVCIGSTAFNTKNVNEI